MKARLLLPFLVISLRPSRMSGCCRQQLCYAIIGMVECCPDAEPACRPLYLSRVLAWLLTYWKLLSLLNNGRRRTRAAEAMPSSFLPSFRLQWSGTDCRFHRSIRQGERKRSGSPPSWPPWPGWSSASSTWRGWYTCSCPGQPPRADTAGPKSEPPEVGTAYCARSHKLIDERYRAA